MATIDRRRGYFSIAATAGAIPELDGLRGIAILLVLLRHAARPVIEEHGEILRLGSWDIAVPLLNGWMGVDLFFVLSGFLVTHHLLQRWPAQFQIGYLLRYWLKRVLRTFPAYYATLIIVITGAIALLPPDGGKHRPQRVATRTTSSGLLRLRLGTSLLVPRSRGEVLSVVPFDPALAGTIPARAAIVDSDGIVPATHALARTDARKSGRCIGR